MKRYKIEAVQEKEFDTLKDMNEWVEEYAYDIKVINVQRDIDAYVLFYGVILNEINEQEDNSDSDR